MFTGLVEEIGTLREVDRRGEAMVLRVAASRIVADVALGDSISVNGVCLTVTSFDRASFAVDVTPETFRHTNLAQLAVGSPVNLERAMPAGGRFGGHIVQGHVDGTGTIVSRRPEANAVVFAVKPHRPETMRYVIPQGSVTLDGISLTVASVDRGTGSFAISIIPHTLQETALRTKRPGDTVNIECDIIGKYVEHLLGMGGRPSEQPAVSAASGRASGPGSGGLTERLLRDNGFLS